MMDVFVSGARYFERATHRRPRVLYVVGTASQREHVATAIASTADEVHGVEDLADVVHGSGNASFTVVITVGGDRLAPSAEALRTFRSRDAASRLLLAMRPGSRTAHQLAALARAGLDDVSVIDTSESLEKLRRVIGRHLRTTLPPRVVGALVPNAGTEPGNVLGLCIRAGDRPHGVEDIARWLQWDRKTLHRKLAAQKLRSMREVLGVGRLLHAALHLDQSEATIGAIARYLQFKNPSTLRRLCDRETHLAPKVLRARGAIDTVLAVTKLQMPETR